MSGDQNLADESDRTRATASTDQPPAADGTHRPGAFERTAEVVVLGLGSGGQPVAEALAEAGIDVVAVEAHRVGGECPYVACIPSKALLVAAAQGLDWDEAVRRRDEAAEHRDDTDTAAALVATGVELLRGTGTVTGPGAVTVVLAAGDTVHLHWTRALVVGTGSAPFMPPVDGLSEVPTWTSADALSATERPDRLVVLGGGAVGCELGQAFARLGCRVELVEVADGLLAAEQPWVGGVIGQALERDGVVLHLGVAAVKIEEVDGLLALHLADGTSITGDRVLVAGGRHPRGDGLGLEHLGIDPDGGALRVDARLRVLGRGGDPVADVFAVGDVNGVAPYTHTASYHAEIVTAELLGHGRDAEHKAIPRVVYTDPPVFCVGLTEATAGRRLVTASSEVADTARAFIEHPQPAGQVEVLADPDGTLVGAAAVGPAADSWAGELGLAVRAGLHADLLADHVHPHPAWSEVLHPVARALADRLAADHGAGA